MRFSTVVGALAASAVLLVPLAGVATAQDRDCADFASQAEAQQALDAAPGDPERLDADGDGIACESTFDTPATPDDETDEADETAAEVSTTTTTTASAPTTDAVLAEAVSAAAVDRDCPDFASRAEAQAVLDADPTDPEGLDRDDDGIACEEHFGEPVADTTTTTTTTTTAPADPADGTAQVSVVPVGGVDTGDGSAG